MIKVFGQTDRDFSSNGDAVLKPYKAKIHKEDNGAFYLDLETGLEYSEYLQEGNIVTVDTPNGTQLFRLHNINKTRRKVTSRAYHVSYDMEDYVIAESYVTNQICANALIQLAGATDVPSPFTFGSDVQTITSYKCIRKTLKEAVFEVLERWGGHLYYDGFGIEIRQNIGRDNGVTVRYAKNLKDISVSYDWEDVCTKLLPVGKDGILLNDQDEDESIYVYSSVQYPLHYCRTVSFTQELDEKEYPDETAYRLALVQDLKQQAIAYVQANCLPKVNYTMKANIDKVTDVGDTIEVIDANLGLDMLTTLISYDWDCLLNQYTECEFGNFRKKLSDLFGTIDNSVSKAVVLSSGALNDKIDANVQTLSEGISAVDTNVQTLSVDVSGLQSDVSFESGESCTITGNVTIGWLTNTKKRIRFSAVIPKLYDGLSFTVSEMKMNGMSSTGGFTFGSYVSGGYDILNDSNITVTSTRSSGNIITFDLTTTASFSASADNTPVTLEIWSLIIAFT